MDLISPLLPPSWRPYAKAWLALVFAVLTALAAIYAWPWLSVLLAVLTGVGVAAQPNVAARHRAYDTTGSL